MSSHASSGIHVEIHGRLNLPAAQVFLENMGLQDFGPVQKFIDSECIRLMEPYMPRQNGILIKDLVLSNAGKLGSGEIVENSPYAHYLYEGIVYEDPKYHCAGFLVTKGPNAGQWVSRRNVTKIPTNRELVFAGAPMRGKKWFERMAADHRDEILQGAQKIAYREIMKRK